MIAARWQNVALISLVSGVVASWTAAAPAEPWQRHTVQKYVDGARRINLQATTQVPTCDYGWGHSFTYMPDKNRLLLGTTVGLYSDDLGATWTKTAAPPGQVTYLGNGKALARGSSAIARSNDHGTTWQTLAAVPPLADGKVAYGSFGPLLVDKDPSTGAVLRLADAVFHDRGYVRFSADGGLTWPTVVDVPWISETVLVRAGNGDIVAATRTDGNAHIPAPNAPYDWRRVGVSHDFYSGLGVHVSSDNGRTWSRLYKLYDFGRHHAGIVLMPDGALVMSYVVRLGYADKADGLPTYGIEAVVSHDHGRTWDLDHRYILDRWDGQWLSRSEKTVKLMAPNETYTALLPDGSLITAYGKGFPGAKRGVQLVRWRPKE